MVLHKEYIMFISVWERHMRWIRLYAWEQHTFFSWHWYSDLSFTKNCHSDLFFTKNKINVMALIHNEVANFQYTVATALHDTQPKISKVTSWWLQCIMVSNNISKTNFKMYINFSPRKLKEMLQCLVQV